MKKFLLAIGCLALVWMATACGAVNAVKSVAGSDANLRTTTELWSDVPRMDGLATSQMEMPVFVHVLMRTALDGMGDGKDTGDWIVFSSSKLPEEVKNFYTNERMAAQGWEPSKNSTCLNGTDQGIPGVGVFCVFEKLEPDKRVELLITASQDTQTKETTVFFVRVQEVGTPVANNAPTAAAAQKPTRGEITMLQGTAPYGIEKRSMPTGLDLEQLLPKQVGPYTRTSMERASKQGVPATSVELDGDSIYAHYRSGAKDIFVEFAVTSHAADAQATLEVAAGDTGGVFPTDPQLGSMGTEPSYLKVINADGAFFAWTRGGYYFSASAKSGEGDLDAFVKAFPY